MFYLLYLLVSLWAQYFLYTEHDNIMYHL